MQKIFSQNSQHRRKSDSYYFSQRQTEHDWIIVSRQSRPSRAPHNKVSKNDMDNIRRHISLLPKVPAHWCRRNTTKIFLEGINTKQMIYNLYVAWTLRNKIRAVSQPVYVKEMDKLNIGFHQPRKDQCWCANFHKLSDEEKLEKQDIYDLHIRSKNAARQEKIHDSEAAKKSSDVITVVFDMEALLYCPVSRTKEGFYKRKLATNNFIIYDVKNKEGYCYMWPETDGKRGSQEVATCLANFIRNEVDSNIKTLNLFADNCAGQNKNSIVVSMLGVSLQAHPSLKQINLKFLETGHTYMECDTMHSVIERASRDREIKIPSDWVDIVRHAKKSEKRYTVASLNYTDFLNYKTVKNKCIPPNFRCTDNTKVNWRSGKWFQLRRDQNRCIFIKKNYWEPFRTAILNRAVRNQNIEPLYDQPLAISAAKYKDLMALCSSGVIPSRYHQYHTNLLFSTGTDDDADD